MPPGFQPVRPRALPTGNSQGDRDNSNWGPPRESAATSWVSECGFFSEMRGAFMARDVKDEG